MTYDFAGSETNVQLTEDQRENNRREQEIVRILALPVAEQQAARDEEAMRRLQYDTKSQSRLANSRSLAPSPNTIASPSDSNARHVSPPIVDAPNAKYNTFTPWKKVRRSGSSGSSDTPPAPAKISDYDPVWAGDQDNQMRWRHIHNDSPAMYTQLDTGPANLNVMPREFSCEHPECTLPPFRTEQLLKYNWPFARLICSN